MAWTQKSTWSHGFLFTGLLLVQTSIPIPILQRTTYVILLPPDRKSAVIFQSLQILTITPDDSPRVIATLGISGRSRESNFSQTYYSSPNVSGRLLNSAGVPSTEDVSSGSLTFSGVEASISQARYFCNFTYIEDKVDNGFKTVQIEAIATRWHRDEKQVEVVCQFKFKDSETSSTISSAVKNLPVPCDGQAVPTEIIPADNHINAEAMKCSIQSNPANSSSVEVNTFSEDVATGTVTSPIGTRTFVTTAQPTTARDSDGTESLKIIIPSIIIPAVLLAAAIIVGVIVFKRKCKKKMYEVPQWGDPKTSDIEALDTIDLTLASKTPRKDGDSHEKEKKDMNEPTDAVTTPLVSHKESSGNNSSESIVSGVLECITLNPSDNNTVAFTPVKESEEPC